MATTDSLHVHKCQDQTCNKMWDHEGSWTRMLGDLLGKKAYTALHMCPTCGKVQYWIYSDAEDRERLTPEQIEQRHKEINKVAPGGMDEESIWQRIAVALILGKYR